MKILLYSPIEGWENTKFTINKKQLTEHYCVAGLVQAGNRFKQIAIICFFTLFCRLSASSTIRTSVASGNWSSASKWSPSGIPANGDTIIIASGHTIKINTNTNNIASLIINGTLTIGNNNTNRTITVSGNITINTGGIFDTAGNGGNNLNVGGPIVNDGIFDMHIGSASADVTFNGSANQVINGTGGTTDFYTIDINNTGSSGNNIVEVAGADFSAIAGFLTLTEGVFKVSGSFTFSNTFFNTASPTINADEGLWLNNPNVTVIAQNGGTLLYGSIHITAGTYNIGTTTNNYLAFITGATFTMEGGAMNIAGIFSGNTNSETITYNQSGGVFTVCTVGNTYSSYASFDIRAAGNIFTMSGGAIVMEQQASYFYDYVNTSSNLVITGGDIRAGNASTAGSSLFYFWSPVNYDLTVFNSNVTCRLYTNAEVLNNVFIGGVLDVATANVDMKVAHNWINNNSFLPGTATVFFNGTANQVIGGSVSSNFNNLTVNNTGGGGITLDITTYIDGNCDFTAGVITSAGSKLLVFNDNATTTNANNNVTDPSYVNGPVKKIGNDAFTFPTGKTGAGYHLCGISAPANTTDAFTAEYMRASATGLGNITAVGLYHVSNCEYWKLDRVAGTSNVNVTLSWNGLSNCNAAVYVNDLASLVVAHFNGSNWNTYGTNGYAGNVSAGTVTWNGVASFSSFSLGSNSPATNPLPVKFSAIKAFPVGIDNRIEWTNQTEEGIEKYEVEKSVDGSSFATMNEVIAKYNAGTKAEYNELDVNVNDNTTWYRIKAVELSGSVIYSPIVKVGRTAPADLQLSIYPNPVRGNQFTIQLNSRGRKNYAIRIFNQAGQQVYFSNWQHNGGEASQTIEFPATIPKGLYIVNISSDETFINSKLSVQ